MPPEIPETEYQDFSLKIQTHEYSENRFVKVSMELTYGCNLKCVHCYTDPYNKPALLKKEMKREEVTAALQKLRDEGFLWLCFTGGEIFMRKDFLEIYDAAYSMGFLITLFTNATLISETIASHLEKAPPFSIEVTLYGATAETYEKVTQVKGSYARCISGLQILRAHNLPLKLKASALTLNAHELTAMEAIAKNLGVSFKWSGVVYPRLDGDLSSTHYRLPAEELLKLEFEDADFEASSCASEAQQAGGSPSAPSNLYRCGCGKLNAHLNPYGMMGTCTWAQRGRFDFRQKPLQEGMSAIAREIRSIVYSGGSPCQDCTAFQFCDKMPEMAAHENSGNEQAPVPYFCETAFGRAAKQPPSTRS